MKQNPARLTRQYVKALREHLKIGPQADLQPALRLGRQAAALGLETLDLARIHEQALATLELSQTKSALTRLAAIFFTEANTPIEETHRAARQTRSHLTKVMATLEKRTAELANSNRRLQNGAIRRKAMEDDFARRGQNHRKCLEESLELQNRLRQLTHQVLLAQENDRKKISLQLQDEIAQTLLGINVRLLTLKQEARNNTNGFRSEIASTQRLVVKSAREVRQAGRNLGGQ